LKDGDLVSVDIGVTFQGYICDSAFSFVIGSNKQAEEILTCANACLENSIAVIREGNLINDISSAIERTAKEYGYEVIKDFCGHGCGIKLHEDPQIFCYSNPSNITKIMAGMVLCIEPMILTDSDKYYIDKNDKWTVRSINHKLTCHVEKMVYVTNEGVEILT
jgi:methionyl aminopeptidase